MNKDSLFKNKVILYLLAFVLFFFIINDYSYNSTEKIAIIVALGVDKEDSAFVVTAEIAIPPSDTAGTEGGQAVVAGRGDTIEEAISNMFLKSGWVPKLNFCNVVIISDEIAKSGMMNALEYFLRSEVFMDSALLLVAKDSSSKNVIEAVSPLDIFSSFSIQKIAFERYTNYSDVAYSNLKDFARKYFDFGASSFVSFVTPIKSDTLAPKSEIKSSLKGFFEFFDLSGTALFDKDLLSGSLGKNETIALNFLTKNIKGASYTIKNVQNIESERPNTDVTLKILSSKREIKSEIIDNTIYCDINLSLKVRLLDTSTFDSSVVGLVNSYEIPKEILISSNTSLSNDILSLLDKSKAANFDPLSVGQNLNSYKNKQWNDFINAENFNNYPTDIVYRVNVTTTQTVKIKGN